ncbi:MAG TPA: type II CAAX endopeptidase family protein [Bryobacteraceae bacterium]|nr:type II CAAX endopeptidase family protein [Bryobacteraceae bacterium]
MTPPLILAEPDEPFWGFSELLLAIAVFVVAIAGAISFATHVLHAPAESGLWSVLEELSAYAILFLALKVIFLRYHRNLFESLGWSKLGPFSVRSLFLLGLVLSLVAILLQYLLQTPEKETPFEKMLSDPASRIAVALMGVTLGPIVEELLFRGFLQPLLIGAAGVFPGILITSLVFGALHLTQNANIWQSGVVIMFVGFVLGTVRHVSGSTRASTIVHVAYNSLPLVGLLVETAIPHK